MGGPYYHEHPGSDHPTYSHLYMNRISWKTDSSPLTPQTDPYSIYANMFGASNVAKRQLLYLNANKKSVLDSVVGELVSIKNKTSSEGKIALEEYETSLREIENNLQKPDPLCQSPGGPTLNYSDINLNYVNRIEQMQRILVFAIKCDLTNVGTIMYAPAVSELMNYAGDLGTGLGHHDVAHHGDIISEIDRLKMVNCTHIGLLKNLINLLKTNGLLANSLVLYGSDMSNGNLHLQNNIPTLLCGEGADLKFAQDINLSQEETHSKLLNSILSLYGINLQE